jgi:hypothetical protein
MHDLSTSDLKAIDFNRAPIVTLAAATTLDPGATDPFFITLTGNSPITITTILKGWTYRSIKFLNTGTATHTLIGHSLAQNNILECTYILGYSSWFCH